MNKKLLSGTYNAIHLWAHNNVQKKNYCEICLSVHKKLQYANKSGKYKRDIMDWLTLCISCHRKYDLDKDGHKKGDTSIFGLVKKETRKGSRLSAKQVIDIFLSDKPDIDLAKSYNIDAETILNIRTKKRFCKHTNGLIAPYKKPKYIKLDILMVNEIRKSKEKGKVLAQKYSVSTATISSIKRNKRWPSIN